MIWRVDGGKNPCKGQQKQQLPSSDYVNPSLVTSRVPPPIYCITCTYCKKLNIAETGRRIDDRFQANLRDAERIDKDAFSSNQSLGTNHSKHVVVCGLSPLLGNSESRKTLEQ